MRRAVLVLVTISALAAGPATAVASAEPPPPAEKANLTVALTVKGIKAQRSDNVARGQISATLTDPQGRRTVIRQDVTLSVTTGGSCRVLDLFLEELRLSLLGLNVNLDEVKLSITGSRRGGVLGQLFCRLARGVRGSAARLDAHLSRRPMRVMRFGAPVYPQTTASQAPNPTCQVLSLVLGPLDLDLLGLIVKLNKVKLDVTATRGGGVLGDMFCRLSEGQTSGSGGTQQPSG